MGLSMIRIVKVQKQPWKHSWKYSGKPFIDGEVTSPLVCTRCGLEIPSYRSVGRPYLPKCGATQKESN